MPIVTPFNQLLDGLPRKERNGIMGRFEQIDMQFGDLLCEYDQPYKFVYFPLTGFISLMVDIDGHPPLEMGLIGNEGMLGVSMILGVNNAPQRGVVQGNGTALRLAATQLQGTFADSPALLKTLNRYQYVLLTQLSQTAACTHFHEVEARLARWLLMTHDRAEGDSFDLTHQYLADMLGVQRSAVTIAAGGLQSRNIIKYTRGHIVILNRKGLESVSCKCYTDIVNAYSRILS